MNKWLLTAATAAAMLATTVHGATRDELQAILTSGAWCSPPHQYSRGETEFMRFYPPSAQHPRGTAMRAFGIPQSNGSLALSAVWGGSSYDIEADRPHYGTIGSVYFGYPPGGGGQWMVFVPDASGQVTVTPDYPIPAECLPNRCSPMPHVSGIVFRRCEITDKQLNDGARQNWEQNNCDSGGYCPPGMTRRPR